MTGPSPAQWWVHGSSSFVVSPNAEQVSQVAELAQIIATCYAVNRGYGMQWDAIPAESQLVIEKVRPDPSRLSTRVRNLTFYPVSVCKRNPLYRVSRSSKGLRNAVHRSCPCERYDEQAVVQDPNRTVRRLDRGINARRFAPR